MVKLIGRGRTADIFEYGKDRIVKLYRNDFPADAIDHELRMSQLVYSSGIPTPQAFESVSFGSRRGVVFQRIHGAPLLSKIIKTPWAIRKHAGTLAVLHYELHSRHTEGAIRQQKQVLKDSIMAAPLLADGEKEKIVRYLRRLPDGNQLCHGDFHPDNVLIGEKQWIIDWMTGMSGNPAGDVARSVLLFSFGTMPGGTPKLIKSIVNMLRSRLKSEYVKQYLRLSGLRHSDIDRWILPVAAARLTEWLDDEEKNRLLEIVRQRLNAIT